jgi:hypothetical protein
MVIQEERSIDESNLQSWFPTKLFAGHTDLQVLSSANSKLSIMPARHPLLGMPASAFAYSFPFRHMPCSLGAPQSFRYFIGKLFIRHHGLSFPINGTHIELRLNIMTLIPITHFP